MLVVKNTFFIMLASNLNMLRDSPTVYHTSLLYLHSFWHLLFESPIRIFSYLMQIACIFKHPNLTVESGLQLLFAAILSVPTRGCTIVQLCNGYSNSRMQHVDFTLHCIQTHYLTTSFFLFFCPNNFGQLSPSSAIFCNAIFIGTYNSTSSLLRRPHHISLASNIFYQITLN